MKVELLTHTPDALRTAFTAIRTCYSPYDQEYIWNEDFTKYMENNNDHIRLVKQIVNHGHTSTLEHINFTFAISGVTRSFLAQLTRHRIASYSVQSQRYVKQSSSSAHGCFSYRIPPTIEANPEAKKIFIEGMENDQRIYDELIALGIPAEDARDKLPGAATTNITFTINLRSFMNLYGTRNPNTHAQGEIAQFVERAKDIIIQAEPWTKEIITN